MAVQNNFAGGHPRVCQNCLALTNRQRKLLRDIERTNPGFTRHFLETLAGTTQPNPQPQAIAREQPKPVEEQKPEAAPAHPAKKGLLGRMKDGPTKTLLLKGGKAGAGAIGATLLYQVADNLEDWLSGSRDAASSVYGVITDNFTGAGDTLSSPLVTLGAALGAGFLWGRMAWQRLRKAWRAAAESAGNQAALAKEKLAARIRAAAEFTRSVSKAAFVALTCYHMPNLMDAGRSLVEFDPGLSPVAQAQQFLNQFFSAAPATLVPLFAYALVKGLELLASPLKDFIEWCNCKRKGKLPEEQIGPAAGQAEAKKDAQAALEPPAGPAAS